VEHAHRLVDAVVDLHRHDDAVFRNFLELERERAADDRGHTGVGAVDIPRVFVGHDGPLGDARSINVGGGGRWR